MKKIMMLLVIVFTMGAFSANAQETKSKAVTTPGDKIHNVIHPHHKKSHGRKYKHTTAHGKVTKSKVTTPHAQPMKPEEKEKVKAKKD